MSSCPQKTVCALTNHLTMKAALSVWQSFYCEGSHARCERFKLANAGMTPPPRLLPNGRLQDPTEQPIGEQAPAAGATRAA
ncbi:MAG: hypothetical protein QM704_06495 [Anaeromyxobacteraceae bacterium]